MTCTTLVTPYSFDLPSEGIINLFSDPAYEDEPVGGVARFTTKLNELRDQLAAKNAYPPLVIFSGDFVGPSLMSSVTHGAHMIEFFNAIGVHYATFGNHEVDEHFDYSFIQSTANHSSIMGMSR